MTQATNSTVPTFTNSNTWSVRPAILSPLTAPLVSALSPGTNSISSISSEMPNAMGASFLYTPIFRK